MTFTSCRRCTVFLAALLLSACTPTLSPLTKREAVTLAAVPSVARVVWVLDRSGSMNAQLDAACTPSQSPCETRKGLVLAGLNQLGQVMPEGVRHSAVLFPTDNVCGAPASAELDVPFTSVVASYGEALAQGGTPTSATLNFVSTLPEVAKSDTFVVLVTDGLPNCNPDNQNNLCTVQTAERVKACNCQTANCQTASFCSLGCLDSLAAVEASQTVAATGKKLMVVGVGSDLDDVTGVFGSMQIALPRACTHDADCPQSSCVAGACGNRLFLAHGDPDWQAPLMRLREALLRSARCNFWVEAGLSREQLIVALNGTPVPDADWGFGGKPEELVFSGQTCDGLLAHADWAPQVSYLPTVYEPL